jgi:hypothetical protein
MASEDEDESIPGRNVIEDVTEFLRREGILLENPSSAEQSLAIAVYLEENGFKNLLEAMEARGGVEQSPSPILCRDGRPRVPISKQNIGRGNAAGSRRHSRRGARSVAEHVA